MRKATRFFRHNAVALVALLVALTGTAYAAHKIGANEIKNNAVRSKHIKNGQVNSSDLASSVRSQLGAGVTDITDVVGAAISMPPESADSPPDAQCPHGYVVTGTGFYGPFGGRVGGFVKAYGTFAGGFFINESSITLTAYVQAVCAKLNQAGTSSASSVRDERARYRADLQRARQSLTTGSGITSSR